MHRPSPSEPDPARRADLGAALHAAARRNDVAAVEALLARGADPNFEVDSAGSATYAAATPALRARLLAAGGRLTPYDLVWLGEDDAAVAAVAADPAAAHLGCGTVFAAVCTLERRALLERLLAAGATFPALADGCKGDLMAQPDMLARLLGAGLSPDLPDTDGVTLLHVLCRRDRRGVAHPARLACAPLLLDAGATLEARDHGRRARPLAYAARDGLEDMVELLLARGARPGHPADPHDAVPAAWAAAAGHAALAARLRLAGSP